MPESIHIGSGTQVDPWKCLRCSHRWYANRKNSFDAQGKPIKPRYCAGCHSAMWDRPKRKK